MAQLFRPEETRLSNGIPVIFQHYEASAAALYWWIQAGSADEGPREAGFAHFLEHMLFKDASAKETGRASTGKMARTIESFGGDINAYTSFDQTVYHVTCAAHHWERVIDAFGTIAVPQKFLKTDFDREREVILEELRKNEDSPGRQLFQTLFSLAFKRHPYGKPVIGYAKTLKAARVADLEAFYRRNYVSGKMGLVLVGPLANADRKKKILRLLERRFGARVITRKEQPRRARVAEPELRAAADCKVKGFDVKTPTLSFAFRVPHLLHEDIPALDLLSGVLGMGELSRLYQRLFYQTSLATEISGGLYVPNDPGMLYFQAEMDSTDKLEPVAREIFSEMRRLREEGPTPEELARVLVNSESERLYATQTADGQAARLGFARFVLGDLEFDERYLQRLREVDVEALKRAAVKYFDPRRLSAVALVPKGEKQLDLRPVLDRALEQLRVPAEVAGASKTARGRSGARDLLQPESHTLSSGLRVVWCPRPQSHVFSLHASVLGGTRLETLQGASHMMAQTWSKGTSTKNARQVAAIVEGRAAHLEGFSGRNSVGLQLTGLVRDWRELSELFNETLVTPGFAADEVEHSRRVVEEQIRTLEDHTAQLCSRLFLEALFEAHPYGKLSYGTLDTVKAVDSVRLHAFHKLWVRPERLVLSVSGPVSREMLDPWLEALEKNFGAGPGRPTALERIAPEPPLKAPRWVERSLGREQVHLLVGGLGTRIDSEERFAIRLLQGILGGQSGRLFIELREKKSLAYSVAPISFEGLEPGYIGTYMACSPQKAEEALSGIGAVLEKLAQRGPTDAEMNRAREHLLGRRAMDLQSDSALAAHFGLETLYDLKHLPDAELLRVVKAVTGKQIQEVCRRYLVDPHKVTSRVG